MTSTDDSFETRKQDLRKEYLQRLMSRFKPVPTAEEQAEAASDSVALAADTAQEESTTDTKAPLAAAESEPTQDRHTPTTEPVSKAALPPPVPSWQQWLDASLTTRSEESTAAQAPTTSVAEADPPASSSVLFQTWSGVPLDIYSPAAVAEAVTKKPAPAEEMPPALAARWAEAQQLLPPGTLCKIMVRKESATAWELCQRKYDCLQQPLTWQEPLQLRFSNTQWLQQAFSHQEMVYDLQLADVQIHKAPCPGHADYRWLELTTRQQGHRLRVYPLPPLPAAQLVMISMQERRVLGLMQRPLQLDQALFPAETLQNRPALQWLQAPVTELEPLFDIEKRVRAAEALIQPQDRFRLRLNTPRGILKARLEFVQTLQPDLQHLPEALQLALQSSAPHWVSDWTAADGSRWYFSCRFEAALQQQTVSEPGELAFALQQTPSQSQLWTFERQADRPWQARSLSERVPTWQPDALFQQLIAHQPLAFAQAPRLNSSLESAPALKLYQVPVYQDPEWQAFESASQVLADIFELMQALSQPQATTQHAATQDLASRIQTLLRKPQLSKSLRRQLELRFEEYRAQTQQAFQHADQAHYIFVFWQTFFQIFFDSLPTPPSLQHLKPCGPAYLVRQGKQERLLQYFSSHSAAAESLIWALAFDTREGSWSLLDLRPARTDGLPAAQPAFSFVQAYHQLSEAVQALMLPHWSRFLPLHHLPHPQEK